MARRLSREGAGFIISWEGIYLYAYPDPGTGGDPWTIGAGHTRYGKGLKPKRGDIISLAQAMELFKLDMQDSESVVNRAIHVDLSQIRYDMCTSIQFNTGSLLRGSVDDQINAGNNEGALRTWGLYVNAAGKRMQGLVNRRQVEIAAFRTEVYPNRPILVRDRPGAKGRLIQVSALPWSGVPVYPVELKIPVLVPPLPEKKQSGNFLIDILKLIWRQFT